MPNSPEGLTRIALLDDHEFVLQGLAVHLEQLPGVAVVGRYSSSRPFLQALSHLHADAVLVDYSLSAGDLDGTALIRRVRSGHPGMRILVVSGHDDCVTIGMVMRAGANGFLSKRQEARELQVAISRLLKGKVYVPPSAGPETIADGASMLTPREWEVVRCFLDGMSVSDIAGKFNRSLKTVSSQKASAFRKLGIHSNAELFKMRGGLMQLHEPKA